MARRKNVKRDVHPVADLFPMLADDELAELAEDIKARGLLHPIVLDAEDRVLDGRNRLAACELAGVEPSFTTYDGDDPDGYALAVNGQRRSMTKAQKALVAADLLLLSNERSNSQETIAKALGVSRSLVSQAELIVTYARDERDRVMLTGTGFTEAREVATRRQRDAEETRAKLDRLRGAAADLLSLVDEERMTLDDACAALDAREQKAHQDARLREQERLESVERHRERIRMVVTGWSTIRDLILPNSEDAPEIVAGLGESDQLALKKIIVDITERAE